MDYIIGLITANTLTLLAAIIIGLMVFLAIIKRFIRLFAVAVFILLCYAGYLYYTGQKVPVTKEEILEHGSEKLQEYRVKEKADRAAGEIRSGVREAVKDEVKKEVKKELGSAKGE